MSTFSPPFPSQYFTWHRASDGLPAAGYIVKFYEAGTSTPKTVYTDPSLEVPYASPSNEVTLDSTGQALIYLGTGAYKAVVCDEDGTPVAGGSIDNYSSSGTFGTGFVDSYEELADVNIVFNAFVFMAGYLSAGDGGHGMFYLTESGASADGGYIQVSTSDAYKWYRIPDENGDVRAASFGYLPDQGTIQTVQLTTADAYAASIGARLVIKAGSDAQVAAITFNAPYVHFEPGARLRGTASPPQPAITFNGIVTGPNEQIFASSGEDLSVSVTFSDEFQVSEHPQWFGAATGIEIDSTAALDAWIAAGGGKFTLPPGTWRHGTPKAFLDALPGVIFEAQGTIGDNPLTYAFGPGYWLPHSIRVEAVLFDNDRYLSAYGSDAIASSYDFRVENDLEAVRDALVGRDLTAGRTIVGNENATIAGTVTGGVDVKATTGAVTAGTNITAGTAGASGYIKGNAGTGGQAFKAGGVVSGGIQNVTLTSAAVSLLVYNNAVASDGDKMVIEAYGSISGSSTSQQFLLKNNGGTVTYFDVTISDVASGATSFYLKITLAKIGTNNVSCSGFAVNSATGAQAPNTRSAFSLTNALTFASGETLKLTAVAASGTVVCRFADMTFYPASPQ